MTLVLDAVTFAGVTESCRVGGRVTVRLNMRTDERTVLMRAGAVLAVEAAVEIVVRVVDHSRDFALGADALRTMTLAEVTELCGLDVDAMVDAAPFNVAGV